MTNCTLVCSDCGAAVDLVSEIGVVAVYGLHADVASGWRKVLCGGCLPGGPVVVTICKAMPPIDLEEAVEHVAAAAAEKVDQGPVKVAGAVTFKIACEVEGLTVCRTSHHERNTIGDLLLARGWKREASQLPGKRRFWWWYQPAAQKRASW